MHTYDSFGWYAGDAFPARSAPVAPDNLSLTETDGELRANWTGYAWVDMPYQVPPELPVHEPLIVVSPWQMEEGLAQAGLLPAIEAYLATAPAQIKRAWTRAGEYRSDNPLLSSVATSLGMSRADVMDFFAMAKSLSLDS